MKISLASLPHQDPTELFKPILTPLLANWPYFFSLVILFVLIKIFRSPKMKSRIGEAAVNMASLRKLDPAFYRYFHDLYLPRPDGQGTTQIDHVVVSPFGIFVIETKNYKGWIFGGEKQAQWTQQIYRKKNRFQNPLHQNLLHIRALMDFLKLPESAFHSVIFFAGDAEFKTPMPPHVIKSGLRSWIENHRDILLNADKVAQIHAALADHENKTDKKAVSKQHLKDPKNRA